ncbi:folate-binding protein [Actinokineospora sp. NBRC 105648]|uniref:CAF17-like 4Fe-4S cluster assembly/insertion protein YgfZ n=1 Tax=Actinokineospora sp. NBRC 105648 TaxID=3032206 RepID=UPI0024A5E8EF|nr:folate-binding protein [Actinokineospora sp. NBRC 105648]GLZ37704.1 glycine cleavage system protein T [Actinokineospora sp. NBRC 105648]
MTDRSPILDLPGAVRAPDGAVDEGVPWHFGDPFAEQRAAARKVAVVDRSHRSVIAVPGEERLSWLHLVISQHVTGLLSGSGTEALVLDSQGRVDAHMLVAHAGDTVWLDTEHGALATGARGGKVSLLEYLGSMVFWSKVEPRDASAERAVLSLVGPETPELLAKVGLPVPTGLYAVAVGEDVIVRRMPWPGHDAADLLVPRTDLVTWWTRLTEGGARPMGSLAFDALRVESTRPRMGVDTDEKTIPHEVNWVHVAAHVAKGCYRGQETVSKVHNVGRPPRRMLLLHLDGASDVLPDTGDVVYAGERAVGRVGSVVQHHELGPIALALIKRSVEPGTPLVIRSGEETTQAAIDPDSIPPDTPALGRAAAQGLRG